MANLPLKYEGNIQPPTGEWNNLVQQNLYPYYPDEFLKEAVNLSIGLNRPLLLEGEPGCGKSRLAYSIIYEFSQKYPDLNWKFRLWNVQSISKAQDGFYSYDYIGRLQAAQLAKLGVKNQQTDPNNLIKYLELGPLGYAFQEKKYRTVVLIDEIDKADTDFPNDLLLALEEKRFEIKDLRPRRWLRANPNAPPIVIITSNQEKTLPNAFLRRCLYHYIEFPSQEQLIKIINARFQNPPSEIVEKAIDKFLELREMMEDERGETGKKVSTSELIDWFAILNEHPPEEIIEKLETGLPFASTLLKSRSDREDFL